MQVVDLSGMNDTLVKIGPYVYVVGPGMKMSIADHLERVECPTSTVDNYLEESKREEPITATV